MSLNLINNYTNLNLEGDANILQSYALGGENAEADTSSMPPALQNVNNRISQISIQNFPLKASVTLENSFLIQLPNDLLLVVFSSLSRKELGRLTLVCKVLLTAACYEGLWQNLCEREDKKRCQEKNALVSWKLFYKEILNLKKREICHLIINFAIKEENQKSACQVFHEIIKNNKRIEDFNYDALRDLISKEANEEKNKNHDVMEKKKQQMVNRDEMIYSFLISLVINYEDSEGAHIVFEQVKQEKINLNVMAYTSLLYLFIKKKDAKGACCVFKEMIKNHVKPDTDTYDLFINLLIEKKHKKDVLRVVRAMTKWGVKPNAATLLLIDKL